MDYIWLICMVLIIIFAWVIIPYQIVNNLFSGKLKSYYGWIALGLFLMLGLFGFSLGPVAGTVPGHKTRRTLETLAEYLRDYQGDQGPFSADSNQSPAFIKVLKDYHDWQVKTNRHEPWIADSLGRPIDEWGTPLRMSLADPKNPTIHSAGADKAWDTDDDIYSDPAVKPVANSASQVPAKP